MILAVILAGFALVVLLLALKRRREAIHAPPPGGISVLLGDRSPEGPPAPGREPVP